MSRVEPSLAFLGSGLAQYTFERACASFDSSPSLTEPSLRVRRAGLVSLQPQIRAKVWTIHCEAYIYKYSCMRTINLWSSLPISGENGGFMYDIKLDGRISNVTCLVACFVVVLSYYWPPYFSSSVFFLCTLRTFIVAYEFVVSLGEVCLREHR